MSMHCAVVNAADIIQNVASFAHLHRIATCFTSKDCDCNVKCLSGWCCQMRWWASERGRLAASAATRRTGRDRDLVGERTDALTTTTTTQRRRRVQRELPWSTYHVHLSVVRLSRDEVGLLHIHRWASTSKARNRRATSDVISANPWGPTCKTDITECCWI